MASAERPAKHSIAAKDRSRGLLIAFEGPEGSGKTTQRKLIKRWLESQGHEVVSTRWASSPLVKPLLKARKRIRTLSVEEYSLLHAIDFRHRIETTILPALWAGKTVLADRYLFTALARDAARGLDLDWLLHVYSPLLWPDLVLYFSMAPEDSSRRIASTRAPHFYEAGQDVTGLDDPARQLRTLHRTRGHRVREPVPHLPVRDRGRRRTPCIASTPACARLSRACRSARGPRTARTRLKNG